MTNDSKKKKRSAAKRFAEIERVSVLGISERMGPLGLHMYAESYLVAAQALSKPTLPFEPVRPYLVCHAIELALKAFLSLRGASMVDLADGPYGHNLGALLMKSVETGLADFAVLSAAQEAAVRLATTYYGGKVFEYPAIGEALSAYPQMPPVDTLLDVAVRLVEALRLPCREAK